MFELIDKLFDTSDFPARWSCGNWTTVHGMTHIVSDFAIFGAYAAIPLAVSVLLLRRHVAFPPIFWLFATFMLFCGLSHFIEATIFWHPWYRLSALVKACTALVSLATVLALLPALPKALALPGLATVNRELREEVAERQATEKKLQESYDVLQRDVTERTRLEHELRRMNEELQRRVEQRTVELAKSNEELLQFAYVASHDLKAPLRAVDHLSHWIEEDAGDSLPEACREHLRRMQQRVQRMQAFLDDLLEYSRASGFDREAEEVQTTSLVNRIVETLGAPQGFKISVSSGMPSLITHRVALEQVFRNLIANAVEHHDCPSGCVQVSARDSGDSVEFVVSDDGPGIPARFHARVFQMFQTLERRDEVEATGMGLAFAKKLVESAGGSIALESGAGRGTTFRFTWPRSIERRVPISSGANSAGSSAGL